MRDLFADPLAKGQHHMQFKADIGPDVRRLFTDAHTCLAFELAARETGDSDAVPYFLAHLSLHDNFEFKMLSTLVHLTPLKCVFLKGLFCDDSTSSILRH